MTIIIRPSIPYYDCPLSACIGLLLVAQSLFRAFMYYSPAFPVQSSPGSGTKASNLSATYHVQYPTGKRFAFANTGCALKTNINHNRGTNVILLGK